MKKYVFGLVLMCCSVMAVADGCHWLGTGPKHATMYASIDAKPSGQVKKNQEIARASFAPESKPSIECEPRAEVYAYATYSEASGIKANYYGEIDGHPAYYLSRGMTEYAYVLIDESGLPFANQPGTAINVDEGRLYPRATNIIIYATMDNPPSKSLAGSYVGSLLVERYSSGAGGTAVGYSYVLKGKITQAPLFCEVRNANLQIALNRISILDFPQIGFSKSPISGRDHLTIQCNGHATAEIKLEVAKTAQNKGLDTVILIEDEGKGANAEGIGFVLSSPLSDNTFLENNKFVKLADLESGQKLVPIEARYYRYKTAIKPGQAIANGSFVIKFH